MQHAIHFLTNSVQQYLQLINNEPKYSLISNYKYTDDKVCITLIPSIFERSPKNLESELSLKSTSDILGIISYSKFNSDLEYYDNNEFKLSYDDF
jgi:hypothetical protein